MSKRPTSDLAGVANFWTYKGEPEQENRETPPKFCTDCDYFSHTTRDERIIPVCEYPDGAIRSITCFDTKQDHPDWCPLESEGLPDCCTECGYYEVSSGCTRQQQFTCNHPEGDGNVHQSYPNTRRSPRCPLESDPESVEDWENWLKEQEESEPEPDNHHNLPSPPDSPDCTIGVDPGAGDSLGLMAYYDGEWIPADKVIEEKEKTNHQKLQEWWDNFMDGGPYAPYYWTTRDEIESQEDAPEKLEVTHGGYTYRCSVEERTGTAHPNETTVRELDHDTKGEQITAGELRELLKYFENDELIWMIADNYRYPVDTVSVEGADNVTIFPLGEDDE